MKSKLALRKPHLPQRSLQNMKDIVTNIEGRVGPPILLWFLGVPGGVCLLLWLFFWRGK